MTKLVFRYQNSGLNNVFLLRCTWGDTMQNKEVIKEEYVGFLLIQYKYVLEYLQLQAEDNWRLKKVKDTSFHFERGYRVQHSYCMIPNDMFDRALEIRAKQQSWKKIGIWKHLLIFGNETLHATPLMEEHILMEYIKTSRYRREDFIRVLCYMIVSASCFLSSIWCVFHSTDFISFFFLSLIWCGVSIYQFLVLLRVSRCIWRFDFENVENIEKAKKTILGINENMIICMIASILILIVG